LSEPHGSAGLADSEPRYPEPDRAKVRAALARWPFYDANHREIARAVAEKCGFPERVGSANGQQEPAWALVVLCGDLWGGWQALAEAVEEHDGGLGADRVIDTATTCGENRITTVLTVGERRDVVAALRMKERPLLPKATQEIVMRLAESDRGAPGSWDPLTVVRWLDFRTIPGDPESGRSEPALVTVLRSLADEWEKDHPETSEALAELAGRINERLEVVAVAARSTPSGSATPDTPSQLVIELDEAPDDSDPAARRYTVHAWFFGADRRLGPKESGSATEHDLETTVAQVVDRLRRNLPPGMVGEDTLVQFVLPVHQFDRHVEEWRLCAGDLIGIEFAVVIRPETSVWWLRNDDRQRRWEQLTVCAGTGVRWAYRDRLPDVVPTEYAFDLAKRNRDWLHAHLRDEGVDVVCLGLTFEYHPNACLTARDTHLPPDNCVELFLRAGVPVVIWQTGHGDLRGLRELVSATATAGDWHNLPRQLRDRRRAAVKEPDRHPGRVRLVWDGPERQWQHYELAARIPVGRTP
jgi:hypothetical protein